MNLVSSIITDLNFNERTLLFLDVQSAICTVRSITSYVIKLPKSVLRLIVASANVYSIGGIRLEHVGPLRYWRIGIDDLFLEESSTAEHSPDGANKFTNVYIKIGTRIAMLSYLFDMPKSYPPSFLVRRYRTVYGDNNHKIKDIITR